MKSTVAMDLLTFNLKRKLERVPSYQPSSVQSHNR